MPPRKNFYRSDPSNHGDEIAEAANDALRSRQAQTRSRRSVAGRGTSAPDPLPRAAAAASSVRQQIVVDMAAMTSSPYLPTGEHPKRLENFRQGAENVCFINTSDAAHSNVVGL